MVQLLPMTPAEYEAWLAFKVQNYADDKVRAGAWEAGEAVARSRAEMRKLLPDGPASPNNYLVSIWSDDAPRDVPVGGLWMAIAAWKSTLGFIYDILVFEPYRRRGYGRLALLALEDQARAIGLTEIGLHVFGHNPGARTLYEKVGYEITDINMVKKL